MWRIPLSDLNYDESEETAVLEVIRSRWLSQGPRVEEFEHAAAAYLGVRHAVAVANCTCAIELAYRCALKLHPGIRSAIVPEITFVATSNAALAAGLRPILSDSRGEATPFSDLSMDIPCSNGEAVLAVMHYAGFDAGIEQALAAARRNGAVVIEDAAHAIGGRAAGGRALGTFGLLGCFSFFANKNMATGEGGLVVTNDDSAAEQLRLFRSHGMTSLTFERHRTQGHGYDVVSPGYNYRCTEITAALAIQQLRKLDRGNAVRRQLYRLYCDLLAQEEHVRVLCADNCQAIDNSACHILALVAQTPELRDQIRADLSVAGIQTSNHYPPISSFTWYKASGIAGECPNADAFASRQITLPLHPGLKEVEVEEIVSIIRQTILVSVKTRT